MKFLHLTTPIFEAPINKLELVGDSWKNKEPSDSSTFNDLDQKLLKNPKHIKRIRDAFNRTKFKFNMYMINHPNVKKFRKPSIVGHVDLEWIDFYLPKISNGLTFENDAINILFLGNYGDNLIPMTPWIIAHRFAHSLQIRLTLNNENLYRSIFGKYYEFVFQISTDISLGGYGVERNGRFLLSKSEEERLLIIFHDIGKFKSARNKNIVRPGEILVELIAQYIITGKIEFNPLERSIKVDSKIITMKNFRYEYFEEHLQESAKECEIHIENILKDSVGKIFVI